MSSAQRKSLNTLRSRRGDQDVVRVQIQVPAVDAQIVRELAAILRGGTEAAQAVRQQLRTVVAEPRTHSVFDIFGSDLPDAYFEGVFEHGRRKDAPREVEL
jgi:hypothetical protein